MKRKLFGTDGIRGKANVYPMTGEIAMALGRAVTHYFQKISPKKLKRPTIIIGKDTRLSCYMLEQAFAAGVCSQGGKAILTGPLPTPGIAFVVKSMRANAGVMISASHNSYEDNGIKIFDQFGEKLPDEIELKLEDMILNPHSIPKRLDEELGNAKRLDAVAGRYIVFVKSGLSSQYNLDDMRLVVDSANGAAYKMAPMAFSELGAEVISQGTSPNGTNINFQCGALHPENCAKSVIEYRADLGICLDGDADRVVIIDETGTIVHGDKLIGILAKYLHTIGELGDTDEVVGTVMSNFGLEQFLKNLGIDLFRSNVGDRYIIERMNQVGSIFGGEPSGHVIFKKYSTTGDGIFAALKVIECMKYFKKPLHELAAEVELFPQRLINVKVKDKKPFNEIEVINDGIKSCEEKLKDTGRVLLRYSGTENLARVMIEGKDSKLVDQLCEELATTVKNGLG